MNYKVFIRYDEYEESPREFDPRTIMVLGNKKRGFPNEAKFNFSNFNSWDSAEKALKKSLGRVRYFSRVYMYEHGKIAFSLNPFSCPFDSGCVGFIAITGESIGDKKRRTQSEYAEIAKNELNSYQAFINGEVFEAIIEDEDGEMVEALGGFYSKEAAKEWAEVTVDSLKQE